jgi:hypothetical protein
MLLFGWLAASSAFADGELLSGRYSVTQGDCDETALLRAGDEDAQIVADDKGIKIGEAMEFENGTPDFELSYSYTVGDVTIPWMGMGFDLYKSAYSNGGTQFTALHYQNGGTGPTTYVGETDVKVVSSGIEIDEIAKDGSQKVCLLAKSGRH